MLLLDRGRVLTRPREPRVADYPHARVLRLPEPVAPAHMSQDTHSGEWNEVMDVVKRATDAVVAVSPRVSLVLKADIRPGFTGQLTAKVERVNALLG
ncbi:MTH1187 family thiamine-binding protein [Nocardioides ginsengisoli]|uniref:MTH1187 family thiamine-binding protein n=1 Tax=Nocardioides ginsengisoli TaxID=363868 RepID=A0ABW3W2N9_9ACTN